MKKVLYTATVDSHILSFHLPYLAWLKEQGFEVHVASNGNSTIPFADFKYNIPFERSPSKLSNLNAYFLLKKIIADKKFDLIHCNTPMGSVITRLAARNTRKKGAKVIYTAHGFHFYNGAPILNWLLYYSIERWLARYTDILITINKEDYTRAKKFTLRKNGLVFYSPGVGIDLTKYKVPNENEKNEMRMRMFKELNIPQDAYVVLSVGELNQNKNHESIIRAIAKLNDPEIYYIVCGQGLLDEYLRGLSAKLGVSDRVRLLGFRSDIPDVLKIADSFAFPSKREGLGLAALEAMATGLPIITSNVHGIVDYSINGETSISCSPNDIKGFTEAIKTLKENKELSCKLTRNNIELVKKFDVNKAKKVIREIYNQV